MRPGRRSQPDRSSPSASSHGRNSPRTWPTTSSASRFSMRPSDTGGTGRMSCETYWPRTARDRLVPAMRPGPTQSPPRVRTLAKLRLVQGRYYSPESGPSNTNRPTIDSCGLSGSKSAGLATTFKVPSTCRHLSFAAKEVILTAPRLEIDRALPTVIPLR